MKRKVSNYFWVGLMTIIVSTFTIWLLAKMTGRQADSDSYHSYYSNVSGLGYGTPVYFEGYRIGQVESVQPENLKNKIIFKVSYLIQKNWKVPTDSVAQIESAGLLGDISINIQAGKQPNYFKPNQEIPGKQPADLLGKLTEISSDIDDLTEDKIKPLLDLIYERTDSITTDLNTQIPELFTTLNESADEMHAILLDTRKLLNTDNQTHIRQILNNVNQLTSRLNKTAELAEKSIIGTQELINNLTSLTSEESSQITAILNTTFDTIITFSQRLDVISSEIENASMNLNEATNQIRKNPSRLIFSSKSESMDDEL